MRKKAFIFIVSFLIAGSIFLAYTIPLKYPSSTSYRIKFTLDVNGTPVTGESSNTRVSIMKDSTHEWLDFDDNTFKSSGWTNIYTTASEDTTNPTFPYYYYDWTLPSTETSEDIYTVAVRTVGDQKIYKMLDISYYKITFKAR